MEIGSIYDIGAYEQTPGVIPQIAEHVGHNLTPEPDTENLELLLADIDGIGATHSTDPEVADALVRATFPLDSVQGWVEHSGLLRPVERTYATGQPIPDGPIGIAVITGASRETLLGRLRRFEKLADTHEIG